MWEIEITKENGRPLKTSDIYNFIRRTEKWALNEQQLNKQADFNNFNNASRDLAYMHNFNRLF